MFDRITVDHLYVWVRFEFKFTTIILKRTALSSCPRLVAFVVFGRILMLHTGLLVKIKDNRSILCDVELYVVSYISLWSILCRNSQVMFVVDVTTDYQCFPKGKTSPHKYRRDYNYLVWLPYDPPGSSLILKCVDFPLPEGTITRSSSTSTHPACGNIFTKPQQS